MTREQLEHLIRACAAISQDNEIIVLGSQAVLGQLPDSPEEVRVSMEADVYPKNQPEKWELIDGSIGELSAFHETFGYYAQGVEPGVAILPEGWEERLIPVRNENTQGATGWCLEIYDLVLAKCVAGREKDWAFLESLVNHSLVEREHLVQRLTSLPVAAEQQKRILQHIEKAFSAV